jgi:hypothetical protein
LLVLGIGCVAHGSFAEDNGCYSAPVTAMNIPKDKPCAIVLEATRVKAIHGSVMSYDLGGEIITIKTQSFTGDRFLEDVKSGRCRARQTVTLSPVVKSPSNTAFTALYAHTR